MTLQTNPPLPGGVKEKVLIFDPKKGADPARYLIDPGDGISSPGNLQHIRPHLVCGNKVYSWPVGVEGFEVAGQATLSIHHYIGSNSVDARTLHREEGRITLSGTFPGNTAQANMIMLRDILRSVPPKKGMVLYAQGVFETEQFLLPETWGFSHAAEDRTHSIDYSVTFLRIGTGANIPDPTGARPEQNPGSTKNPKGTGRYFTTRTGARTFRQIAKVVYGNENSWMRLQILNVNKLTLIPGYMVPTALWPLGIKIRY